MRIIKKETYEELSRCAADMILAAVREKPECVLGLATGSTPIGTYDCLAAACREGKATFRQAKTINLDEYTGLGEDDPQSYRFFMKEHLFRHIDIRRENTHIPNGLAPDAAEECKRYEALYERLGGLTFNCSALAKTGILGHEPSRALDAGTHVVELSESTRHCKQPEFCEPFRRAVRRDYTWHGRHP